MKQTIQRRRARIFSEEEIMQALLLNAGGMSAHALCRDLGITRSRFYTWRERYGGARVPKARGGALYAGARAL